MKCRAIDGLKEPAAAASHLKIVFFGLNSVARLNPGDRMPHRTASKICVRCGADVAGKPRAKDLDGRYYCKPACVTAPPPQDSAGNSTDSTAASASERIQLSRYGGPKPIPDELAEVAKWERQLGRALLPSIVLPPLALLLIPAHVVVAFNLANALGRNGWLWAIPTIVPYLGLLILVILNFMATSRLRTAGLRIGTFGAWQWAAS